MEHLDAGQFLDLDRPRHLGPLFEQAQAHLNDCAHCRKTLLNLHALRALALETAPELPRSLTRAALIACRQADTSEKLIAETGEDAARELLLRRPRKPAGTQASGWRRALVWGVAALFCGAGLALLMRHKSAALPDSPLPFEYHQEPPSLTAENQAGLPLATPAVTEPGQSGREAELDAQAQELLMAQLRKTERPAPQATLPAHRPAPERPLPSTPGQPTASAGIQAGVTAAPSPQATSKPAAPSPLPSTPLPVFTTQSSQALGSPEALENLAPPRQAEATLQAVSHESDQPGVEIRNTRISAAAGESSLVWVSLPEATGLEIKLFNRAGQAVHLLAEGRYGPGHLSFKVEAKDTQGMPLTPGEYYLRVMSRWFSKVELLTVLP